MHADPVPAVTAPLAHARTAAHRRRQAARRRNLRLAAGAVVVVAATVATTAALAGRGSGRSPSSSTASDPHAGHPTGAAPAGYTLTGRTSAMGGPILETPGAKGGTANAGGITVDGTDLTMGRIPLAYAVEPTWTLTNTSDRAVTLGKPALDIVKGCCPGELTLGTTSLAPGASTTLTFPLQMHPGMDGDHLFRIAVPVDGAAQPLALSVAGDFR